MNYIEKLFASEAFFCSAAFWNWLTGNWKLRKQNKRNCANKKNDAIFETTLRLKRTFHTNKKSHKSEKLIYDCIGSWNWLQNITFANVALDSLFNRTNALNVALHSNKHNSRFCFFSFISSFNSFFFCSFAFHKVSNSFHFVQFEMSFQFWMSSVLWVFPFVQKFNLKFFCTVECSTVCLLKHSSLMRMIGGFCELLDIFSSSFTLCCHSSHSFFLLKWCHLRFNFFSFLFFSFHHIQQQPFCVHFNLVLSAVVERFCFNATFCTQNFSFCALWSGSGCSLFISNMCRTN